MPVGAHIDNGADVPQTAVRLTELSGPLEAVPATTRLFLFDIARATPVRAREPAACHGPGPRRRTDGERLCLQHCARRAGARRRAALRQLRPRSGRGDPGARPDHRRGSSPRAPARRRAYRRRGCSLRRRLGRPRVRFLSGPAPQPAPLADIAGLAPPVAYSTAVARDTLPGYADFVVAYPRDPLVGRVRAMAAARREALFWSEAVRANTPRPYWTYLRRYPRGPHLVDVRRQLFRPARRAGAAAALRHRIFRGSAAATGRGDRRAGAPHLRRRRRPGDPAAAREPVAPAAQHVLRHAAAAAARTGRLATPAAARAAARGQQPSTGSDRGAGGARRCSGGDPARRSRRSNRDDGEIRRDDRVSPFCEGRAQCPLGATDRGNDAYDFGGDDHHSCGRSSDNDSERSGGSAARSFGEPRRGGGSAADHAFRRGRTGRRHHDRLGHWDR